jgi:AhpD family alkylhydroperoxidase
MPRLCYIEESEKTPHIRELIESAKRTGAPDPRVVSLMTRTELGIAWVEYWNKLLLQGMLPHKLKEMCRIKISVAHQCGYCSTVRSTVAKEEGLTEDMIDDLFDYAGSKHFSAREKAALHYAGLFKQGEHAIDKDEVYAELAKHFSDEEIIELGLFCAEVDGVGKFVKSLNVLSWEEACEFNPKLKANAARVAAE